MKCSLIPVSFLLFFGFSSLASSQTDSCSSKLSVNTNLIPFNSSSTNCFSAWSSEGFSLRYGKTGQDLWSFVLSAPDTGSFIAIGFSSDGGMVGSSAVAGWITSSGPGIVKQYYLGGTRPGACQPDQGDLELVRGKSVIIAQSSRLYLAFQLRAMQLPSHLIYAVGPKNSLPSSDNRLPPHRNKASASINYATGVASDAKSGSGFSTVRRHGVLVILGWGILMPIGAAFARYCKHWDPQWFYFHISIQGMGFVLGVTGIIIGFRLNGGDGNVSVHKAIGISILVFGCLQVMAFLARPNKSSKVRKYWNWYHWYVGRAALACAMGNIYFGLSLAHEESSWRIGYGIYHAIWAIVCVVLEVRMWMNKV